MWLRLNGTTKQVIACEGTPSSGELHDAVGGWIESIGRVEVGGFFVYVWGDEEAHLKNLPITALRLSDGWPLAGHFAVTFVDHEGETTSPTTVERDKQIGLLRAVLHTVLTTDHAMWRRSRR